MCGSPGKGTVTWLCGTRIADEGGPEQTTIFTPMCEWTMHALIEARREATRLATKRTIEAGEFYVRGLFRDHGASMATDAVAMFVDAIKAGAGHD